MVGINGGRLNGDHSACKIEQWLLGDLVVLDITLCLNQLRVKPHMGSHRGDFLEDCVET